MTGGPDSPTIPAAPADPGFPPPPPVDSDLRAAQARRIRRRRVAGALSLVAVLAGSGVAVWFLSGGGMPARSEWAFAMTQVDALQARGLTGSGVVVCLVDTGIDLGHPDLARVPVLAWRDFVKRGASPYDDDGHGTAMAGLIAGRGALRGVAPGVSLIVAKALDSRGRGTSAGLAAAIDFCVDPNRDGNPADGAGVVSLSLAAATNLTVGNDLTVAVASALASGVVVVASAGNDGLADDGDVQSPASIPGVIAVGSVDDHGAIARFSSIGAEAGRTDPDRKPELVAPGVDLLTTAHGGGYRLVSGTSASAAFVSGAIALILEGRPGAVRSNTANTPAAIKAILTSTAERLPGQRVPHDPHYGYGLVQVASASYGG